MTHAHFFLPPNQWSAGALRLSGEEARHCAQVTRHRTGDQIIVFDGCGRTASARIESISPSAVQLSVQEETLVPTPSVSLTLVQGIVKGDTMDWIIEKAVELGVQRIVPLICQRSIVRLNAAEAEKKQAKWHRVALEACKQCGQTWLPEVVTPCGLDAVNKLTSATEMKLVASLDSTAASLQSISQGKPLSAAIAIGPEGDFTEAEYRQLRAAGWHSWSLGKLTLRSETAAICALSILGYQLAHD